MRARQKQHCVCGLVVFLALLFAAWTALPALAEAELPEDPVCIDVFLAGEDGAVAYRELPLRDEDGDGLLTVSDALLAEDGRIPTMLGGGETAGLRIYVNHTPVTDLLTALQEGDQLYGLVCEDEAELPYCRFDLSRASVREGETLVLTLTAMSPEGEGQPVADAVIRIDGKDTAFRTDADGKVTLQFDGSGSCVVSARKEGVTMAPPVCAVTVGKEEPFAGDRSALLGWLLLSAAAAGGILLALRQRVRRLET